MPNCIYTLKKQKQLDKFQSEYIIDLHNMFGGTIHLAGKFVNRKTITTHFCSGCGLTYNIKPTNLLKTTGCKICRYTKIYNDRIDHMRIELIGTYSGMLNKIEHKCLTCGHNWLITPNDVSNGHGCPKCARKYSTDLQSHSQEQYVKILAESNPSIILLGRYTKSSTKTLHRCLVCGFEWNVLPSNLKKGSGCLQCKVDKQYIVSKGEKEVAAFVKEIYNGLVIENDRSVLNPKELDVYLPEIGFAVEYNGDYWHRNKPKGYHSNKTNRCADQGIKLLHVWESDWKADVDLCKYNIQEALLITIQSALPI